MESTTKNTAIAKEQKPGEVTRLAQNLESAVRISHELLTALEDKLAPVLRIEPEEANKTTDSSVSTTQTGSLLSETLYQQYRLQARIESLFNRLEV